MTNTCAHLLRGALIPCLLFIGAFSAKAETNPRLYAVEVSATVQAAPPQITLRWSTDASATGYSLYKKAPSAAAWTQITSLPGSATTWSDANVANGGTYEYAVTKNTSVGYQGTGYVLAGINASMTENRGKLVLIVDNTHATALASELARLQQDLVGDGWTVLRQDVSRAATPPQVKQIIKNAYDADPTNVKSVFLFGHVAVPYSGNYNPDGHPDHQGAWAADTYYADMDGLWTDSSVNNSGAEKAWNRNVPGDGKFDQSDLPSDVELAVGRVDLYNMTCYSNKAWSRTELDLLRAYLNKDHNFRHGQLVVPRRGLVCDNFGEMGGEAFASTGWRSFAPFFGAQNNVQVPYGSYFSTLKDNAYLWSYGTGGGSWYTCNGIGSSDDFANVEVKTVFTAFLGSYFGDWDNESAFLRAPLGSGYTLATAWGGRPHWFFHPMGLGEPIGVAAKLSQNNRYGGLYSGQNWGTRQVHVTLLGDPSLRMHPVIPPANVAVNGGTITWSASTDSAIQGYNIYRASSANGPFTKVNGISLVTSLFFTDGLAPVGSVYMVRAVKLEQSGSGSYFNLSQGSFSGTITLPDPTPTPTPTSTNGAVFVKADTSTSGSWKGIYGVDGQFAPNGDFSIPAFVQINATYNYIATWESPSIDTRALQKRTSSARFATRWNNNGYVDFYLKFKDSATHRVSIYLCDFDRLGRSEKIDVYDNVSGNLLGTTTVANLENGTYSTWDLRGSIKIRFTNTAGLNTVLGGIFFDPVPGVTPPPSGGAGGNAVRFLGVNTTIGGAWKSLLGTQGYQIAAEGTKVASYANVTFSGKTDHVWNWSTTDSAALQKGTASDRLASCWYSSSSFDVRVNVTDGQTHKVSFYALDWDVNGRAERVDVLDAATGAILQTTSLSGFQRGAYVQYDIKGSVVFRFSRTAGANAVISGLFFDSPSASL